MRHLSQGFQEKEEKLHNLYTGEPEPEPAVIIEPAGTETVGTMSDLPPGADNLANAPIMFKKMVCNACVYLERYCSTFLSKQMHSTPVLFTLYIYISKLSHFTTCKSLNSFICQNTDILAIFLSAQMTFLQI